MISSIDSMGKSAPVAGRKATHAALETDWDPAALTAVDLSGSGAKEADGGVIQPDCHEVCQPGHPGYACSSSRTGVPECSWMFSGMSLHRKTDQVTVRNAEGGLIEKDRAKSEDLEPITRRYAGCVALPEATTKFYYRYEH